MRSPTPTPWSPLLSRMDTRPSISSKNITHGLDARALQAGTGGAAAAGKTSRGSRSGHGLCTSAIQEWPTQRGSPQHSLPCTCLGNAYSLGKERRQSLLALTHVLAEQLWAFDGDVVELGLAGDRPGQQRFTAARGAVQQDACSRQTLQADSHTSKQRTGNAALAAPRPAAARAPRGGTTPSRSRASGS